MRRGRNEIEVFDLNGGVASPVIAGLGTPILNQLMPNRSPGS
jgi:hypothetical protein